MPLGILKKLLDAVGKSIFECHILFIYGAPT